MKSDLLREVKRLLLGEQVDRELLGLLSAANGGLSADDLAELTERQVWEVEERLASVAGRSWAWILLAETVAETEDRAEARTIAARAKAAVDEIDNPVSKSTHLSSLIDTATTIGDHDSADALISERELVLNALGEEIRAILEGGPKEPLQIFPPPPDDLATRRGMARRLESDGWTTALGALGVACPEALTAAADELMATLDRLG